MLTSKQEIDLDQVKEEEGYFNFINSIRSEKTKEVYYGNLKLFMKFNGLDKMSDLLKIDAQNSIIKYVMSLRQSGLSSNSISVRLNSIFHFYSMNDVVLNKKKIKMFKGGFPRKTSSNLLSDKGLRLLSSELNG